MGSPELAPDLRHARGPAHRGALARMGAPRNVPGNQPDLLRALDGIQVAQEGRVVRVNIDLAEDLAEKLVR